MTRLAITRWYELRQIASLSDVQIRRQIQIPRLIPRFAVMLCYWDMARKAKRRDLVQLAAGVGSDCTFANTAA